MISFILILLSSLFFTGVITRAKSIFSGRKGPGIFQPMRDIARLFRKGSVYSTTSGLIFRVAPSVYITSVIMAILLVPFGGQPGVFSFAGDFIFFAYVLAAGKFFLILSAMDTGSSFEGMGSSREALYSMLAEPAFFILMGSFALYTGHTSFAGIFATLHFDSYVSYALALMATFILAILAMIENSRMPIDDPRTHLELTMVHEVMILDHSGFDLGLILHTTHLKFAMYGALIANLFIWPELPLYLALTVFFAVQVIFAIVAAAIESFMARFRMYHNPQYIFAMTSIAILVFLGVLIMLGKIE